jgi:cytochrome c oxidase cbb3-type subunit III
MLKLAKAVSVSIMLVAIAATATAKGVQPIPTKTAIQHGAELFGANCGFCHGVQAAGTEQAPSLVRSPLVRADVNGDRLVPMIKAGRPSLGMPSFASLAPQDLSAIVAFLHFRASEDAGRKMPEVSQLLGDEKAGAAFFNNQGGCSKCHSPTGDLKTIGAKYAPLALTFAFLTPPPQPIAVKVVLASGETHSGTLKYEDEFVVSMVESSGEYRTWPREQLRSVILTDPLAAHKELLAHYTDADIHNLLAYLVTLK